MFIGVSRSNVSRLSEPPEPYENAEFDLARPQFLKSVNYKCSVCGFTSPKYQHVHHIDGNHKHNEMSNFDCRDPLCHLCEHLWFVADNKMGTLIFCPSLTQAELNAYVRIAWVTNYLAKVLGPEECGEVLLKIARESGLWLELWESSKHQVKRVYSIMDIRALAEDFRSMTDAEYQEREKKYPHLRLLFHPESFSKEIEEWSRNKEFFADFYNPNEWPKILKNHLKQSGKQL
ncbi:hypothetical protein OCT63_18875 [Vibrio sp. RW]|uniref:hypothetical protein n=1 Tax=Vibrio sp. RW TaxID=2998833 RepID=UPI0022CD6672|nr:hypothetical protein [Vibrio sp. RW]MDA0146291.1 hypothetical protein [Vibrio sp. RW]